MLEQLLDLMICDESWVKTEIIAIFANLGENCSEFEVEEFYVEIEIMRFIVELLQDEDIIIVESTLRNLFNIF